MVCAGFEIIGKWAVKDNLRMEYPQLVVQWPI
jgi:hypothetical protein